MSYFCNRNLMFLVLCFYRVMTPSLDSQEFLVKQGDSHPNYTDVAVECGSWMLIGCACCIYFCSNPSSAISDGSPGNDSSSLKKNGPKKIIAPQSYVISKKELDRPISYNVAKKGR